MADKQQGSSSGSGARGFGGPGRSIAETLKQLGQRIANLLRGKR
jgi:hypothetical protein